MDGTGKGAERGYSVDSEGYRHNNSIKKVVRMSIFTIDEEDLFEDAPSEVGSLVSPHFNCSQTDTFSLRVTG